MNKLLIALILVGIIIYIYNYMKNAHKIESFLDSRYTPATFGCSIDPQEQQQGLAFFKTKKIIICGLIRDGDNNIPLLRKNVEKMGSFFKEYHALIVENDSTDNTRGNLLAWAKQSSNLTILGCGENVTECKLNLPATVNHSRKAKLIKKMVMLRNIYLDYIAVNPERFSTYDFVVVWDMDIQGTFYEDGIGQTGYLFKTRPEINSLCANGIHISNYGLGIRYNYYDPFAHKDIHERNLRQIDNFWLPGPEHCSTSKNPKLVKSCFNGLTIYRKSALTDKHYVFKLVDEDNQEGEAQCEHVTLHRQIGGSYINPMLIFVVLRNG